MNPKDGFWKAALGVAGIGAIGAFVFLSLYKDWLKLQIFSQLTPEQTFWIMGLFLLLVFAALVVMVLVWWSQKIHENRQPPLAQGSTNFHPPEKATFKGVIEGLAGSGKAAVTFVGFDAKELKLPVKSQSIDTSSLKSAFIVAGKLTDPQLNFSVEDRDGFYLITKTP